METPSPRVSKQTLDAECFIVHDAETQKGITWLELSIFPEDKHLGGMPFSDVLHYFNYLLLIMDFRRSGEGTVAELAGG